MKVLVTAKKSYIGNSFLKWIRYHKKDLDIVCLSLRDIDFDQFSFKSYDVVFHVAGIAHISSNKNLTSKYFSINRDLALKVAEKAKIEGVKQFIFD
jgi:UDP-glucose 4-epimerase